MKLICMIVGVIVIMVIGSVYVVIFYEGFDDVLFF